MFIPLPRETPHGLTQKELRQLLTYNKTTGAFTWRRTQSRNAIKGDIAGTLNRRGALVIGIKGHKYSATKLAYLYCYDVWPRERLIATNGDPAETRVDKLTPESRARSETPAAIYARQNRRLNNLARERILKSDTLLRAFNNSTDDGREVMKVVRNQILKEENA